MVATFARGTKILDTFPSFKSIFSVLTGDLVLNRKQRVCITQQFWITVVLPIIDPSLSGIHCLLQDNLSGHQKYVKHLSGRRVPHLTGTTLQPFPFSNMRFLGKFQSHGDHCFNSLIPKREGIRVCLE